MKTLFRLAILLATFNLGTALAADLTDVNEIVKRANLTAFYQGDDGRAETGAWFIARVDGCSDIQKCLAIIRAGELNQ